MSFNIRTLIFSGAACLFIVLAGPSSGAENDIYVSDHEIKAGETTVSVDGQATRLAWDTIEVHAETPRHQPTNIRMDIALDLSDLQQRLASQINRRKSYDECGLRSSVSSTRIIPGVNARAVLSATLHGEFWQCVKTKIPEVYCEDTWIETKLPFGGHLKTKGIPKCRTEWNMKTAKTRVGSQSADVSMDLIPTIANNEFAVDVQVTNAKLSGLAGELVKLFGWDDEIRKLVQQEVGKALKKDPLRLALPEETRPLSMQLMSVQFTDRGTGRLGAKITATAQISIWKLVQLTGKLSAATPNAKRQTKVAQ
jgi:hypothetical protein